MSRILHLLCLSAILCVDHVKARSTRRLVGEGIQGGSYANDGQFPYQISLELEGESVCGGSILSERFVITTAHCVVDDQRKFMDQPLKVVAGISNLASRSKNRVAIDVVKVYVPEEYDPSVLEHGEIDIGDIAILELNKKLHLSRNPKLSKVKLPKNNNTYVGINATISGFGLNQMNVVFNKETLKYDEFEGDRDNKLRFAEAKVMSSDECQKKYDGVQLRITKEKHLCAALIQRDVNKPEGICTGDSGGALIYNGTIIGVLSTSSTGCRENERPAIYTRISSYLSFIKNVIRGNIDNNIRTTTLDIVS